jgi:hypothetical protein
MRHLRRFPWPFVITYESDTGRHVVFGPEGDCIEVCLTRARAERRVRHEIEVMRGLGDIE